MSNLKVNLSQLKTALVYDRVNTAYGGAEQVLLALHQLFPQAPLYTAVYDPQAAAWAQEFEVKPGFVNKLPAAKQGHRWLAPLMPLAFESFDLTDYDLVLSVTSAEAKGIITRPEQLHVCYLLTPQRYLYHDRAQYWQSRPILNWPGIRFLARRLHSYLRWWDQAAAYRPDVIIPLSKLVKQRARQVYQRATLDPIYPPTDVISQQKLSSKTKLNQNLINSGALKSNQSLPNKYLLVVNRLVPNKRIDLAIRACQALNLNLIIVGDGPQKKQLQQIAATLSQPQADIWFLPSQPQIIVNTLMQHTELFLAPGIDDFGLSPLHANLMGAPALINADSGAAEVFTPQEQGVMIQELSPAAVSQGIKQALCQQHNSAKMKKCVLQYNQQRFINRIKQVIIKQVKKQQLIK